MDDLSDDEEDGDEMRYVEKQFNLLAELSILVDYDIISKYMLVLIDEDYKKQPELLEYVSKMFKRIGFQLKQSWIFFQLEYLIVFEKLMNLGMTNNSLMKGMDSNAPMT
jgi:hypothetical protein